MNEKNNLSEPKKWLFKSDKEVEKIEKYSISYSVRKTTIVS